ncbi:hypothetical protein H4219_000239 [Mycoemilia scoparia]|uniref:NADH-ubiquinone oxidoreductase 12 kDa subunit n=1 Tax=Mycoemilia scoparia TaxID=417184 RepID=A0A9W8DRN1_9FUNG|nr:hypothetical protein H4219_000239 [Mycoemilia scoparia]
MSESQYAATPDNFETADRAAILQARADLALEQWVKVMETRLVRAKLQECYKRESVNHFQNCRELVDRYMAEVNKNRVKGWHKLQKDF